MTRAPAIGSPAPEPAQQHGRGPARTRVSLRRLAALGLLAGIPFGVWFWGEVRPLIVERVVWDFQFNDAALRAEDMNMDPLLIHAPLVKARIIAMVADRTMVKRRYAIGFLGVVRAREAAPVLRTILADESEMPEFRADALESLFQISAQGALRDPGLLCWMLLASIPRSKSCLRVDLHPFHIRSSRVRCRRRRRPARTAPAAAA